MSFDAEQFVRWFRSASPYIHVHRGKTIVIQFDDDAVHSETFTNLVHDLALLNSLGVQLVLVYGTRRSIEQRLEADKLAQNYHAGVRITDGQVMEIVKETAGKLRVEIESHLSMGLGNTPMAYAGLRVTSGNFVTAKPRGVVEGVDYLYTGEVRRIDVDSIRTKLDAGEIVVVPPLGYSITGETFNLGAGALAARLAVDLNADKLIYLMEAEGICDQAGDLVRQMNREEAAARLDHLTGAAPETRRYLESAVLVAGQGVRRIHLIDRRLDGAILQELFTPDGAGTMISSIPYDVMRQATVDDISGILDLIAPMEKQGVLVERSREKLELEIDHFTLLERDGVILGCAALYPLEAGHAAELACVAVHEDYHGGGRGQQLLTVIETDAAQKGIQHIYVLTTHAEHWFLEHGFVRAGPDDLPVARQSLYNYQRNSKVLVKQL